MEIITLADAPAYDSDLVVAERFLDGSQCNVRVIRFSPAQVLPAHTHGISDLMIYAVEGAGTLDTDDGSVAFRAGSLAFYRSDEELRLANNGSTGLTVLAFLAPPFPPGRLEVHRRATHGSVTVTPQFRLAVHEHQRGARRH